MSYVAEWRGGGLHSLSRWFDPIRNCPCIGLYKTTEVMFPHYLLSYLMLFCMRLASVPG